MKDTLRNNRDVTALSALLFPPYHSLFSFSHTPSAHLLTRGSPPRGRPYPCPVLVRQRILFIFSVEIYMRMSTDLLPTPAKSHYIFNLRDLSKCVQGKGCL